MQPSPDAEPTTPHTLVLIEVPRLRWDASDALQGRRRVPDADLDVLTAASTDETWFYAPRRDVDDAHGPAGLLAAVLGLDREALPAFRCRRLTRLLEMGGPAEGRRQTWHYTSQTDIPAAVEEEFNRWFDEEHLPRLAELDGTVHAARHRTDGTPRYLAGYDLTEREVQGSAEWKAAIESPWRTRIHGRFVGPRRLMLRRLLPGTRTPDIGVLDPASASR